MEQIKGGLTMSNEESSTLSAKDWAQSVKSINKIGYMDGAYNGQSASFQSSFDAGYIQGLNFGMKLGFHDALLSNQEEHFRSSLVDPRKINCQLCVNRGNDDKIDNIINIQEEKNSEFLKRHDLKNNL